MEIVKSNLVLSFETARGKELNLTIKSPVEQLNGETIGAAMEAIIMTSALGEESVVASKVGAKYVVQQVEEITLS